MDPTLNQSSSPWNSQQGLYDSNLSLAESESKSKWE